MRIDNKEGIRILQLDPAGPVISSAHDTSDLIGNAWMEHVDVIGIPVARLDPRFFRLDSLFAGEIIQKAVNYGVKLAVIGDISRFESSSDAFRAFVGESNRGEHVWFVPTEDGLDEKLLPRRLAEQRANASAETSTSRAENAHPRDKPTGR